MAFTGIGLCGVITALACVLLARDRRAARRAWRETNRVTAELDDTAEARDRARDQNALLVALALRAQALIDAQIDRLVELERDALDPAQLDALVGLDHLAVQVRRKCEAALVASGRTNPRRWRKPVALTDVTRAAVAEVDGYARVQLLSCDDGMQLDGGAVADVAHLLAELIDGALVAARGRDTVVVQRDGRLIAVRPGAPVSELARLLARRHGAEVDAHPTTTIVRLPAGLVVDPELDLTVSDANAIDLDIDDDEPVLPVPPPAPAADAAWPLRAVPAQVVRTFTASSPAP